MLTDAHCHPFDLYSCLPKASVVYEEDRRIGVLAAASACGLDEFVYNEDLAKKSAGENPTPLIVQLLLCFAVHPQLPAVKIMNGKPLTGGKLNNEGYHTAGQSPAPAPSAQFRSRTASGYEPFVSSFARSCPCKHGRDLASFVNHLEALYDLAAAGRLAAVGECGFDLFNASFRETESVQDRIFAAHLETALRYDLPVVLHVRRAMHKIFANVKNLARCRAVVFHSWPGAFEEGMSLLRRGVNAYFSFGNTIRNGHKQAMLCCSRFPAERLLTETDAPFQPPRGQNFSCWADLPHIIEKAAALRNVSAKELEAQIENNFRKALGQINFH